MRIGIVGVGAMGLPMALRLRDCGFDVAVHDIDPRRTAAAREGGCRVEADAATLGRASELLIVVVVDGAQTRQVLFGDAPGGAARALPAGATVLLCPTISPEDVEDAAARLQALGLGVIDAPMSGGPARARDGSMSLMVAGADAVVERVRPALDALSTRLFRVGTRPGHGARTKLVNNLLAAINLAGAAQAHRLAMHLGLDAAVTQAVIAQSSGQSWIGSDRAQRWLAGDAGVHARMALLAKDSALALACARDAGLQLPVAEAAAAAFAQAVEHGLRDADDSALLPPR